MLSTQTKQTMLSTEIVAIINEMRDEGAAELLHKNFMVKIVKVLGEEHSAKFLAQYKDVTGRSLPCYALPKREVHLMVMSENYNVQAAVYDKMVELEQNIGIGNDSFSELAKLSATVEEIKKYHSSLGIALSPSQLNHKATSLLGIDENKYFALTGDKKTYKRRYTAAELGCGLRMSRDDVNKLLVSAGLQTRASAKGGYLLTSVGLDYGAVTTDNKIMWLSSTNRILRKMK